MLPSGLCAWSKSQYASCKCVLASAARNTWRIAGIVRALSNFLQSPQNQQVAITDGRNLLIAAGRLPGKTAHSIKDVCHQIWIDAQLRFHRSSIRGVWNVNIQRVRVRAKNCGSGKRILLAVRMHQDLAFHSVTGLCISGAYTLRSFFYASGGAQTEDGGGIVIGRDSDVLPWSGENGEPGLGLKLGFERLFLLRIIAQDYRHTDAVAFRQHRRRIMHDKERLESP